MPETTADILGQLRAAYARSDAEDHLREEAEANLRQYAERLESEVADRTAALRLANRRMRVLIRATGQMIWIADASGRILEAEGWTELTGRPFSDLQESRWGEVLHPDEAEMVTSAWRVAIEMGAPYTIDHQLRGPDGQYRKYSARGIPLLNEQGTLLEWIGMTTSLSFRAERPPDSVTVDGKEVAGVVVPGLRQHDPPVPSAAEGFAVGVTEGGH